MRGAGCKNVNNEFSAAWRCWKALLKPSSRCAERQPTETKLGGNFSKLLHQSVRSVWHHQHVWHHLAVWEVVDQTAARTLTETRASWRAGRPSGALDSNTHWPIPGKKAPNMRKREPDGTQISFTIIPLAQTSLVLSVLFSLEAGRRVAYRGEETGPYGLSPTECVPCASLQFISLDKTHTHMIDDMIFILLHSYIILLHYTFAQGL